MPTKFGMINRHEEGILGGRSHPTQWTGPRENQTPPKIMSLLLALDKS